MHPSKPRGAQSRALSSAVAAAALDDQEQRNERGLALLL